jgi:hypothetical protein
MVAKRRTTITSRMVRANSMITTVPAPTKAPRRQGSDSNPVPAKVTDVASVLRDGRDCNLICAGHIVEASPCPGTWGLAEVITTRRVDDTILLYVHYYGEHKKFDEWLTLDRVRCVPVDELGSRLSSLCGDFGRGFFDLSIFSPTSSSVYPRYFLKNTRGVQIGNQSIVSAWYPSPFPEMVTSIDSFIRVCDTCLAYVRTDDELARHWRHCQWSHPPGTEIYRTSLVSVFEIDGEHFPVYSERLLLLAKLFLE